MKEQTIEDFYNLLRMVDIYLVYCPNQKLGTKGPMVDIDLPDLKRFLMDSVNPFEENEKENYLTEGHILSSEVI